MPEPDVDELTELLEPSPQRRLPFAFARRHGVFLLERDGAASLCLREGAALTAVQEAQAGGRCAPGVAVAGAGRLRAGARRGLSARFVGDDADGRRAWATIWIWPAWPTRSRKPRTCWSRRTTRRSFA